MENLNQSTSYYRRLTYWEIIYLGMGIFLVIISKTKWIIPLIIVSYPFCFSKVLVSDINHVDKKIWVRITDWNIYRKLHGISYLGQYLPRRVNTVNQQLLIKTGADQELYKYKRMLDRGLITEAKYKFKCQKLLEKSKRDYDSK